MYAPGMLELEGVAPQGDHLALVTVVLDDFRNVPPQEYLVRYKGADPRPAGVELKFGSPLKGRASIELARLLRFLGYARHADPEDPWGENDPERTFVQDFARDEYGMSAKELAEIWGIHDGTALVSALRDMDGQDAVAR